MRHAFRMLRRRFPVRRPMGAWAGALGGVLVVSLAACSSGSSTSSASEGNAAASPAASSPAAAARALLPASVRQKGVIVDGSEIDYAPLDYYNSENQAAGLDPDLLRAAGQVLGVSVQFQNLGFTSIIPSVQTGRIDVGSDGFGITPERQKVVSFVRYMVSTEGLLVKAGNPAKVSTSDVCGEKLAIEAGSEEVGLYQGQITQACVSAGKPKPVISLFSSLSAQILSVSAGRFNAAPMGTAAAANIAQTSHGNYSLAPGGAVAGTTPLPTGFIVPKDNGVGPALAAALKVLAANGTYQRIMQKYSLSGSTATAAFIQ